MRTRLLLGSLLIGAIVGLFVLDASLGSKGWISGVVVVLGLGAWLELARLGGVRSVERGGGALLFLVGLAGTAYFLALPLLEDRPGAPSWLQQAGVAGLLLGGFSAVVFRKDYERGFQPLLFTIAAVLLYGFLLSYLIRIYRTEQGLVRGLVFIFGVKGNDIAAYLVGRAIGKHRFLQVSPKKTVEGCLAAVVFSLIWFPAAAALWPGVLFPWPVAFPLAIIFSMTTQIGDLAESLLKRCYQVKDSSSLLPEFGGILDLLDSVLFTGFAFWVVLAPEA